MITVTFLEASGNRIEAHANAGDTLMQAAVGAGVEGIAAECGGAGACGTCHCVLPQDWFDRMPAPNSDETDMLDFVIDPQPTSRLSCQVSIGENMDGMEVQVPDTQI
ncbi:MULTISPECIES: 2Fe-2S iron-sulfur cluster-binding protein [unclassified Shimia]|uniref:2Fe-2S iron-sulfur cluster-binding protein n=1 Tax=unclassified Shimia TaxID=2630038 RepID=UPI001ADC0A45|nr:MULTISPECIES: 2Fe-2S iron-sulfur cluster-binding protein [unclassified Shimia]MBO9473642.1 2Fe-2S iron-sulfur cluster binding domain-containing protein [Shimia sp. R10_1]MDA5555154.1 2Fe-2S iron-sulfur cluster-binding protein [Shimia sp. MMG029]